MYGRMFLMGRSEMLGVGGVIYEGGGEGEGGVQWCSGWAHWAWRAGVKVIKAISQGGRDSL